MSWQLRATAGPLEGAIYPLHGRVTLGRAGDCDIQIVNDGVSRKHAKVVPAGGGHNVVDLKSNNGTYVGDDRVGGERSLKAGDELRIMLSRFIYEPAQRTGNTGVSGVWAVKVTSGETLRQTVDHLAVKRPKQVRLAPQQGDTQEDLEARTPLSRPSPARGGSSVAERHGRAEAGPERHRVSAVHPDGTPYLGDLLGDIVKHRQLQLRMTRGETLSPAEHEQLRGLSAQFRQPPDATDPYAGLRRFVRWQCRFPARVRWLVGAVGRAAPVLVQDLGVGGSRVAWRDHPLKEGVVAWLVIDLISSERPRTLVFPTRVAWATSGEMGLQFAGTVEWEPFQPR